ncbi:hypothetical protein D3C72_1009980 [compost metagenome]
MLDHTWLNNLDTGIGAYRADGPGAAMIAADFQVCFPDFFFGLRAGRRENQSVCQGERFILDRSQNTSRQLLRCRPGRSFIQRMFDIAFPFSGVGPYFIIQRECITVRVLIEDRIPCWKAVVSKDSICNLYRTLPLAMAIQ